jgi:hypothetical protein
MSRSPEPREWSLSRTSMRRDAVRLDVIQAPGGGIHLSPGYYSPGFSKPI